MSILILRRLVNRYNYYYSRVGYYNNGETIEDKVRRYTNYKNEVSESDLKILIGGKEPDYPIHTIGTIKLRKSFMSSYYKIIDN